MPLITGFSLNHATDTGDARLSRRIFGPPHFFAEFKDDDDNEFPAQVKLTCEWNKLLLAYEVKELTLDRRQNGPPITSHLLRQIPVGDAAEKAQRHVLAGFGTVRSTVAQGDFRDVMETFTNLKHQLKQERLTNDKLEWVALLHEMSSAIGSKPTQELADLFEVSLRTASNWVRAAREKNFLDVIGADDGSPA
ncbi:MAG: hypothetical protein LCH31_05800 [Actinobacteria bacterium]|nr:hypothetical protein [Actinomycetota bacterium]